MSDAPFTSYKPVSATPYDQPDLERVGVTRLTPCFEHFRAVCGRGAGFRFGGDFMRGEPGLTLLGGVTPQASGAWPRQSD